MRDATWILDRGRLVGLIALGVLGPGAAPATTWHILENGLGDAATIQEAMAQAADGDTVLVWPGIYEGSVRMTSGVSLIGQAGEQVSGIYEADYRDFNRETYVRGRETFDETYAAFKRLLLGVWRRDERAAESAEAAPEAVA